MRFRFTTPLSLSPVVVILIIGGSRASRFSGDRCRRETSDICAAWVTNSIANSMDSVADVGHFRGVADPDDIYESVTLGNLEKIRRFAGYFLFRLEKDICTEVQI